MTARSPILTLGIKTELSTKAPVPTWTSYEATVRLTCPPAMIEPAPTIESCAIPFSENFAGGNEGGLVSSGQSRLYKLKIGWIETRSICAS